jgi:anti-sigma regulatory factor (Ser/Thr protein kinase)
VRISAHFTGESGAIPAARHIVADLFQRLAREHKAVAASVVDDVQLVVSELVTNAVKHTAGPCGMDLSYIPDGHVQIAVWDTSARPVTVMPADPGRIGRHGMEIVAALCGGFTVTPTPTGKKITVRMPLRPTGAC